MNFSQLNNKAWWWHSGTFCCENLLYTLVKEDIRI